MTELDEIRFWAIVTKESERTVMCNPDLESRIKSWVDAAGLGGMITVVPQRHCPMDQVFVLDMNAMQANLNEVLARPIRIQPADDWRPPRN